VGSPSKSLLNGPSKNAATLISQLDLASMVALLLPMHPGVHLPLATRRLIDFLANRLEGWLSG
jgi:hypothetical protein